MTSVTNRQKKSATRFYAVQALFQMEAANEPVQKVEDEFLNHRFAADDEEFDWIEGHANLFKELLSHAVSHQAKIDQLTDAALVEKWPIDRIDPTIRALFRAAGAELVIAKTPPKVVISEFVDVAKSFFPDGREAKFINGVLDHMARALQPEKF